MVDSLRGLVGLANILRLAIFGDSIRFSRFPCGATLPLFSSGLLCILLLIFLCLVSVRLGLGRDLLVSLRFLCIYLSFALGAALGLLIFLGFGLLLLLSTLIGSLLALGSSLGLFAALFRLLGLLLLLRLLDLLGLLLGLHLFLDEVGHSLRGNDGL